MKAVDEWDLANRDLRVKHPNDARSKFERWVIESGGAYAVSKIAEVHVVTIYAWLARRSIPNIIAVQKILAAAGDKLTLDDIVRDTAAQ